MAEETAQSALEPARLAEIWLAFSQAAGEDEALLDFARGHKLCTLYRLRDARLDFYLLFRDGQVSGGVGEAPVPAHVKLILTAALLDELFQGQIDGRKAALSGKMAFSGSISRGLSLQIIQNDLSRVYRSARRRVLAGKA